ncbi:hypothetical protein RFI_03849 [Reticulomyxa filosa]|uniref:Uncharacterized protein n=1 Tax=Reticulomyxa filosa TaxID=46433 RepID=X6P593_RETFI|nr:hypothetical protein RFI_03849 [Reticulomyxa filosa]|eukprot:ETO33259.1 hypothetical protein RFI_03849 [Reticulomyxa filosa]
MSNQNFQMLKELPILLDESQCVLHKHELLICGGKFERACYSYHTIKNEYKFICNYPSNVELWGHCVVTLVNNNKNNKDSNQITLLSFGGSKYMQRHTLVMKYISVWNNLSNKLKNCNEWTHFTDNHNHPIIIGKDNDDCVGVRAVIGGTNNHLLFITHRSKKISVFDLNTLKFIKHDTLPTNDHIWYHCFVSTSENGQGQGMMKTNQQNNKMLLFCAKTGLSIEYDEDNNNFKFHQLSVCKDIAPFKYYAMCVSMMSSCSLVDGMVLLVLMLCVAILSEENDRIHIIGGQNDTETTLTHMRTNVNKFNYVKNNKQSKDKIKLIIEYWIRNLKIKLGWIDDFDTIITKYR